MTQFIFHGLQLHSYGAILADPPWGFRNYSGDDTTPHRTADEPYPVMSLDDICRLPVAVLAAPDCALFLWTISSHLEQAFQVGKAWGFAYKSKLEWLKTTKDGAGLKMGMGKWARQESETLLLFTRGKPPRLNADVRSTIWAPATSHSRKPDEAYSVVERLVGGPYCELFATRRWPGWSGWGSHYPPDLETSLNRLTAAIRKATNQIADDLGLCACDVPYNQCVEGRGICPNS